MIKITVDSLLIFLCVVFQFFLYLEYICCQSCHIHVDVVLATPYSDERNELKKKTKIIFSPSKVINENVSVNKSQNDVSIVGAMFEFFFSLSVVCDVVSNVGQWESGLDCFAPTGSISRILYQHHCSIAAKNSCHSQNSLTYINIQGRPLRTTL